MTKRALISVSDKAGIVELAQSLFGDWAETMIWSCLQGVMGEVFVDNEHTPQSALARIGRFGAFGFLAGQPCLALIEACRGQDMILVPQDQAWADMIETSYGEKARAFTRYATKKDTQFNREKLNQLQAKLSTDFQIQRIEEDLYELCLADAWSQDLVGNYDNYQHYRQSGLGFVVLHHGEVVAGASSYSTYQNGIEIEMDTHPDFRRQGLATAVAAKLILTCLDRGLYPSWDAHTKISLDLAEKLGYEFSHTYIAYEIDWDK